MCGLCKHDSSYWFFQEIAKVNDRAQNNLDLVVSMINVVNVVIYQCYGSSYYCYYY